jgi:hypothetical protein
MNVMVLVVGCDVVPCVALECGGAIAVEPSVDRGGVCGAVRLWQCEEVGCSR